MKIDNQINNISIIKLEYFIDRYIIKIEILDSYSYIRKIDIKCRKNEIVLKVKFTKFKFLSYKKNTFEIISKEVDKLTFK